MLPTWARPAVLVGVLLVVVLILWAGFRDAPAVIVAMGSGLSLFFEFQRNPTFAQRMDVALLLVVIIFLTFEAPLRLALQIFAALAAWAVGARRSPSFLPRASKRSWYTILLVSWCVSIAGTHFG